MKPSNGQGPTDNDDFSDATMIDSSMQYDNPTWQGNEAPVDDFNDPAAEEIAQVSEITEGVEGDSSANNAKDENKSHFKWLPIAASIVGVVFIGAMLYLQFGSAPSPPPLALMATKPSSDNETMPKTPQPELDTSVAPTSPLTPMVTANQNTLQPANLLPPSLAVQNGVALPGSAATPPTNPPSMATSPIDMNAAIPGKKPSQADRVAPASHDPGPTDLVAPNHEFSSTSLTSTTTTAAPKPESELPRDKTAPAQTYQPSVNAPIPPHQMAEPAFADNARIATLTTQIDALRKELATTQQQLAQANERLQEIKPENQLSPKTLGQSPTLSMGEGEDQNAELTTPPAKATPNKKATPAPKPRKPASQTRKTGESGEVWILRAASPDEAWVAKSRDSRALQPVRVGDTLQGIGRVTAIRQDGDQWIVEGTQGRVR